MEWLIWIGTALVLAGLLGLVWCVAAVFRARRAGLSDDALRARLRQAVVQNLAALALSTFGLVMVVVGVFLA